MVRSSAISDITNPTYEAGKIVKAILEGTVAMPDFQRDFVWKPKNVLSLLASVSNRWPIGAVLISGRDPASDIAQLRLKGFKGGPEPMADEVEMVIFDGQQRLTTLLHVFNTELADRVYYIPGFLNLLIGELDGSKVKRVFSDEDFASLTAKQFTQRYDTLDARVAEGVATIRDVYSSGPFADWMSRSRPIIEDKMGRNVDASDIEEARKRMFGNMESYPIGAIHLESHLGLEPLAVIFETVNKTGVQLGVDDLMLAKLYGSFNLKNRWDEEVDSSQLLSEFADTWDKRAERQRKPITALHLLRLIALHLVRGIKRGNVLGLNPAQVEGSWDDAVDALKSALKFLKQQCGVVHYSLLPDDNMVLPIAAYWLKVEGNMNYKLLVKWYWRSIVDETYMTNTSTRPVGDLSALEDGRLPSDFSGDEHDQDEALRTLKNGLLEQRRRHDILANGVAGLLIGSGASDWDDSQKLSTVNAELDLHHIIPLRHAGNLGWSGRSTENPVNVVANLTPLRSTTNGAIGSKVPGTVFGKDGGYPKGVLGDHEISEADLDAGDSMERFNEFVGRRAAKLAERLLQLCY